jgi:hypothetical protein
MQEFNFPDVNKIIGIMHVSSGNASNLHDTAMLAKLTNLSSHNEAFNTFFNSMHLPLMNAKIYLKAFLLTKLSGDGDHFFLCIL